MPDITITLSREEAEVLVDDGQLIPDHEWSIFDAAQDKLRAALSDEEGGE